MFLPYRFFYLIGIAICLSLLLTSCGNGSDNEWFASSLYEGEEFQLAIQQAFPHLDTADNSSVAGLYKNQNSGVWIKPDGKIELADRLLTQLERLAEEGLPTERYYLSVLKEQLAAYQKKGAEWSPLQIFTLDTLLSSAYAAAAHDLVFGFTKADKIDEDWHADNDSIFDLKRPTSFDNVFSSYQSEIPVYNLLKAELHHLNQLLRDSTFLALKGALDNNPHHAIALIHVAMGKEFSALDSGKDYKPLITSFQAYAGIKESGKIDEATHTQLKEGWNNLIWKLRANLERVRWLPSKLSPNHLMVIVPMQKLYLQQNDKILAERKVIVGKPSRKTPSLSKPLQNIVYNPSWGVPPTIKKQDVIPGISRKGGAYLQKKGLKAYDNKGRLVTDVSVINKSNMHKYHFKQPPGARNALGNVKFNLPNMWDIYLHDTPERYAFSRNNRAISSGCVRVESPLDLAELILEKFNHKNYKPAFSDSIIQTRKTTQVDLLEPIMVHIIYLTAFTENISGNRAVFYPDIYKKDEALIAALKAL